MKTRLSAACALVLTIGAPASAHRLDEYLQATTLSLAKDRVQATLRLTPGVKVFPGVFASIDTDHDGILSEGEQRAYAEQVRRDLSLTINGVPVRLRMIACKFAQTTEMKAGRGEIQLDFDAQAPPTGSNRNLVFENHHQSRIAVYLVNCLVPRDPNIQVSAQHRNYLQSHYELDYAQASMPTALPAVTKRTGIFALLGATALLLCAPLVWLWWRARVGRDSRASEGVSAHKTVSPEGRQI